MYTRTYFKENEPLSIPENYDGNAFREEVSEAGADLEARGETEKAEEAGMYLKKEPEKCEKPSAGLSSLFEKLPMKSLLGGFPFKGFLGKGKLVESFGYEEILIAALMIYMFFSKNGDKECAIMLLFLLFVS